MRIAVLGAGAWGTALAMAAARQGGADRSVVLWARDAQQAARMQAGRVNARYLPGQAFPPSLAVSGSPLAGTDSPVAGADLVIVATPMAALRDMLVRLAPHGAPVAWLCKGFE
ncbi:MAG: glycerol-3-phosphate dehydrogenase, partial [Burkholderiales bacterium]